MSLREDGEIFTTAFKFKNKIAYVPGGYGDLGKGVVLGLAKLGARVALSGRNEQKAKNIAAEFQEIGLDVIGFGSDSSQVSDIKKAYDIINKKWGVPEILVNAVGISELSPAFEMDEDTFNTVIRANLNSAMFLDQVFAKQMAEHRIKGRIVHLSSVRSFLGLSLKYPGMGHSAYAASKGALSMIVKQHAAEFAEYGITVNSVSPTIIRSQMLDKMLNESASGLTNDYINRIPFGRMGEVSDVAGAVLYFCSGIASFVTGQNLFVDGGLTAVQ